MSKKKANKRSILEARRAQSSVNRESYVATNATSAVININLSLPISSIKKGLAKDFIFAFLSVVLLVYLKESGLGFSQLSALFTR